MIMATYRLNDLVSWKFWYDWKIWRREGNVQEERGKRAGGEREEKAGRERETFPEHPELLENPIQQPFSIKNAF
jgi:hypothetical protein